MKIPAHIANHSFEYIVIGVLGLAGLGALGYMDLRHWTRAEAVAEKRTEKIDKFDEQIQDTIDDDARLRAYNLHGSAANAPARNEIMAQNLAKRERLQDQKNTFVAEGRDTDN